MYRIQINDAYNTLELYFKEHFDAEQGEELFFKLSGSICRLSPGFKLLTDLSQLKNMDIDAHRSIDKIMDLCSEHGVSKIVRVITSETRDIGFNIMSLFHYSQRVVIHTCDSLEKAQKELGCFK